MSRLIDRFRASSRGSGEEVESYLPRTKAGEELSRGFTEMKTRRMLQANITYAIDVSSSVDDDALGYALKDGLNSVIDLLKHSESVEQVQYNVRIIAFSGRVVELLPFTRASGIRGKIDFSEKIPHRDVTRTDLMFRDAFSAIDKFKKEQDDVGIARSGSLLIVITDGKPTNANGVVVPLSENLVEEIRKRTESRKTVVYAIGLGGDVDKGTLSAMGPRTKERDKNGTVRDVSHSVCYTKADFNSAEAWRAVLALAGHASMPSNAEVPLRYSTARRGSVSPVGFDDFRPFADGLDPEAFVIF